MNKPPHTKKWKMLFTPKEACDNFKFLQDTITACIEPVMAWGRVSDKAALTELLKDVDAVILDVEKLSKDMLITAKGLKVISRFGEGYDAIDINAAKGLGIKIARTRGVASLQVARHTMALILSMMHHVPMNDRNMKKGEWKRVPNVPVEGLTLGVAGYGMIGKHLAKLASFMGFKVIVFSKRPCQEFENAASIEELVSKSDVVSLHIPLSDSTRGIVSDRIVKILDGKYLVNTSRGALVDENAVLYSLNNNGLKGYAADVFVNEPISGTSSELAGHERAIVTPHIAAYDELTARKMTERAVLNAINVLNGQEDKVESLV